MKNYEIALSLIEFVGGKENVKRVFNCMTRCRLELFDYNKVKMDKLKKLEGILGVVQSEGQLQIIFGLGKVNKITEQIQNIIRNRKIPIDGEIKLRSRVEKKNNSKLKNMLKIVTNIFIPLIPLFVACGIVLAINNICNVYFDDYYRNTTIAQIISLIGNGVFVILPILVGVNASKEFGSQMPMIGGVLGGIISSDSLNNINLFGENLVKGRGGIISVILVVALAVYIEKQCKKIVPNMLDLFVTPFITLVVSAIVALVILQPIGGTISDLVGNLIAKTISSNNVFVTVISGAISGALFLPLAMTGMHQVLIPIHANLISTVGYTVLLPVLATAGMAQVGATFAVISKTKNQRIKNVAKNGLLPGILGIGEPLIYGVTFPLGKPFIAACLGAAVGGGVMAFFKVSSVALGVSGLPLALLISTGKMGGFLIGTLISYISGYVFTNIIGFEDPIE